MRMDENNTICCPWCDEWQHLDALNKDDSLHRWTTLECEDCHKLYRASTYRDLTYYWEIEKYEKQEEPKIKVEDVPGQLFFWKNLILRGVT
ncbi:MAG: hypothetical protein ACTSSP_00150 [Candidatus Asgardarchaeia archaeon]